MIIPKSTDNVELEINLEDFDGEYGQWEYALSTLIDKAIDLGLKPKVWAWDMNYESNACGDPECCTPDFPTVTEVEL